MYYRQKEVRLTIFSLEESGGTSTKISSARSCDTPVDDVPSDPLLPGFRALHPIKSPPGTLVRSLMVRPKGTSIVIILMEQSGGLCMMGDLSPSLHRARVFIPCRNCSPGNKVHAIMIRERDHKQQLLQNL